MGYWTKYGLFLCFGILAALSYETSEIFQGTWIYEWVQRNQFVSSTWIPFLWLASLASVSRLADAASTSIGVRIEGLKEGAPRLGDRPSDGLLTSLSVIQAIVIFIGGWLLSQISLPLARIAMVALLVASTIAVIQNLLLAIAVAGFNEQGGFAGWAANGGIFEALIALIMKFLAVPVAIVVTGVMFGAFVQRRRLQEPWLQWLSLEVGVLSLLVLCWNSWRARKKELDDKKRRQTTLQLESCALRHGLDQMDYRWLVGLFKFTKEAAAQSSSAKAKENEKLCDAIKHELEKRAAKFRSEQIAENRRVDNEARRNAEIWGKYGPP